MPSFVTHRLFGHSHMCQDLLLGVLLVAHGMKVVLEGVLDSRVVLGSGLVLVDGIYLH